MEHRAPPATLVWRRTVFTVSGPHTQSEARFDDRAAADAELRRRFGTALPADADGEFGGCLFWCTEQVPDELFDELVDEYASEPHHASGAADWGLDRTKDFLLIEANAWGGWWLSSHDTAEAAADYHDHQESAADWGVVELVNHRTGQRYVVEDAGRTRWRPAPG